MKKSYKKAKQIHKKQARLTPEQTLEFLDDFAKIVTGRDEPTQLISLRVPKNILTAFKFKAKNLDLKYQSQIVKLMRAWVKNLTC